jgi:hypothetical protein
MSGLLQRALEARIDPIAAPMAADAIHFVEMLLYEHLDLARQLRQQMDRMAWSLEYADIFKRREAAVDQAKKHLFTLQAARVPIDELLQAMCRAEDIAS